jgi:hypothetical protein
MANESTVISRQAATGTATVVVACKLPNGLHLQHCKMIQVEEASPSGFHKVDRSIRIGPVYTLRGPRLPTGMAPSFPVIGGYAITPGIPKDFWDEWVKQNKDADYLALGEEHKRVGMMPTVFAADSAARIESMCREFSKMRSGMEPLDPEVDRNGRPLDPRFPRAQRDKAGRIGAITTMDQED